MTVHVVCEEGHSRLADPWEGGEANEAIGPCIVCGASSRLWDRSGEGEDSSAVTVPGYEILRRLRGGAMARVYEARHRLSGRVVALKVNAAGPSARPVGRGLVRREARTLGELDHPNIIRLLEQGEAGGLAFFSMEYHPGGSLADRLSDGPLPPRDAVGMAASLAGVTSYWATC